MIILGLSGALGHDPSAALLVDGEVIAAAEEERFVRDKHAKGRMPVESARWCLADSGVRPVDIDVVAFPFGRVPLLSSRARWHYARRHWYAPDRALDAVLNGNRRFRRNRRRVIELGETLGVDWQRTEFVGVEHHLAHASSAYHLSGFHGKTAILGVDGKGEYATTFLGYGDADGIHRLHEFYDPDSLSGVYGAMTQFLGFEMLDGEYKVMGMAPYGDAKRYDLSRLLLRKRAGLFEANTRYVNTVGVRRYKEAATGFYFSPRLVEWLGPRRVDDAADEPYIHYAAAMQELFENWCLELIDEHLGGILAETGRLAFAGGGALNVKLNQRILARDDVDQLFVQPAAGDSGTSLGAATYVAASRGESISALRHVFLGPRFTIGECTDAVAARGGELRSELLEDVPGATARLLAAGHPVAWFQGRVEFGPRALGGRSILGCPSVPGIADRINEQIKFRERWRPFCPSVRDIDAAAMFGTEHPAPFMTITFDVAPAWREKIPEVVHVDGTARVQIVERDQHPRYYALLDAMAQETGVGVVLNTSLNRRGEPIVSSPQDALEMFLGSDLEYLIMEDVLVTKAQRGTTNMNGRR